MRKDKAPNPFDASALVTDPKDAAINLLVRAVFRAGCSEEGLDTADALAAIDAAEVLIARRLLPERCGACGEPVPLCSGH